MITFFRLIDAGAGGLLQSDTSVSIGVTRTRHVNLLGLELRRVVYIGVPN